jgi:nicotinamidase/pyrazinamidase
MDALILVDIQNDFLPGGSLAVPRGDEVIPVANRLIKKFDLVIATQDWHPKDHGSFASRHPGSKPGDMSELHGLPQVMWPDHCVQNTHGAEFAATLDLQRIKHVIRKGTDPTIDSYSGFFDNGHRKDTGLADLLRKLGVTRVVIAGLATDYCVKATALDARKLGFETVVVRDGVRGVNLSSSDSDLALAEMTGAGVSVISEHEVSPRNSAPPDLIGAGRFLKLVRRGKWEFVMRTHGPNVVAVVPITDDGRILLVEQFRTSLGVNCIEIPAGLVGDHTDHSGELEEIAARRELLEETGYDAGEWTLLSRGPTTPGLSDEVIAVYLARRLRRVGPVLGDGDESITLHEIELKDLLAWLKDAAAMGKVIDIKLYSGLFLAAENCANIKGVLNGSKAPDNHK